jgi:Tfp pilus assembly protein PilW
MRILCGSRGATLVEQLLAVLLGSVVISAVYGFYRAELYRLIGQQRKTATLEDARGAMDIMARDLKNAGSWGSGSAPLERGGDDPNGDEDSVCNRVYAASATMIHVQMDLNGNGTCADNDPKENLRYELAGSTATCPGKKTIRRNGDCLVANVTVARTGTLFNYFDEAGADLGDRPLLAGIRRVQIAFSVQEKDPDPAIDKSIQSGLVTSVLLRN